MDLQVLMWSRRASHYGSLDPGNISTFQGKAENQGYYVFALPR